MTEEEKYELIDAYIDRSLSGEALIAFEKQLELNDELKQEVALHRQLSVELEGENIYKLRAQLKNADKNFANPKEAKLIGLPKRYFYSVISIAASVLLLIFACNLLFFPKSISNEELYAANFKPYKMVLNQRSGVENVIKSAKLNTAIESYDNENYKTAAIEFSNLATTFPNTVAYPFYQAISELNIGNADKAILILKETLKKKDHLLMEQSRWYLALAYLQKDDLEQCQFYLNQIKKGAFNHQEAQGLLKEFK